MTNQLMTDPALTTLLHTRPYWLPDPAEVTTVLGEVAPGAPGSPPHRHPGPVFGYVTEGELVYEVEGQRARVIHAGEAFWEPGGDRIHYRAANNLADRWTRFVAVMVCVPGEPMVVPVAEEELERRDRRAA